MRVFYISLMVIINFLFQTTIFQYFRVGGVLPNTTLIIIVSLALLKGKKMGGILGLIMGLLQDIIFHEVIGVYALLYFLIGYTAGIFDDKVYKENSITAFIFTGVVTVCFHILYYLFMYFLSVDTNLTYMFRRVIWIELIYNLLLSVPIYKLSNRILRDHRFSFRNR